MYLHVSRPLTVYFPKVYKFKKVETFNFPSPLNSFDDVTTEVLNELHRSQESGYNMRDSIRQNHLNRAKICSKIIKYPHLEDYAVRIFLLRAVTWFTHLVVVGVKRTR